MVQRTGLAAAMVSDPELLLLDEPMSGLDPVGRKEVRDLILEEKKRGKTVFFSTHILSDVETLCDASSSCARADRWSAAPVRVCCAPKCAAHRSDLGRCIARVARALVGEA